MSILSPLVHDCERLRVLLVSFGGCADPRLPTWIPPLLYITGPLLFGLNGTISAVTLYKTNLKSRPKIEFDPCTCVRDFPKRKFPPYGIFQQIK